MSDAVVLLTCANSRCVRMTSTKVTSSNAWKRSSGAHARRVVAIMHFLTHKLPVCCLVCWRSALEEQAEAETVEAKRDALERQDLAAVCLQCAVRSWRARAAQTMLQQHKHNAAEEHAAEVVGLRCFDLAGMCVITDLAC